MTRLALILAALLLLAGCESSGIGGITAPQFKGPSAHSRALPERNHPAEVHRSEAGPDGAGSIPAEGHPVYRPSRLSTGSLGLRVTAQEDVPRGGYLVSLPFGLAAGETVTAPLTPVPSETPDLRVGLLGDPPPLREGQSWTGDCGAVALRALDLGPTEALECRRTRQTREVSRFRLGPPESAREGSGGPCPAGWEALPESWAVHPRVGPPEAPGPVCRRRR